MTAFPAIYSTTAQQGIDINAVFVLDLSGTPEYPAPPFQPGELAWGTDGSEWVYCTASITIAAGNAVLVSQFAGSWSVALLVGATVSQVGPNPLTGSATTVTTTNMIGEFVGIVGGSQGSMVVPAPSGTQIGTFFWVQRAGNCPNIAMNGAGTTFTGLHSTTTAGSLSSSGGGSGTTVQVTGIVWSIATASATGPNPGILNYPYISAAN
jgi:hypothetical protein